MNLNDIKLELYVVVNQEGKFFRSIGRGGYGPSWVDTIDKAKIYAKLGQARSRVTYWYNNHPKFGRPKIVQLTATGTAILDEAERLEKVKEKKLAEQARYKAREAKYQLERAERQLKEAQEQIKRLKK
jgi:hypothetical protein